MHRLRAIVAAIALLACFSFAAPALGASTVAPIPASSRAQSSLGGPVFVGDRIAFAAPSAHGGYDVVTEDADGARVVTQHLDTPGIPRGAVSTLYLEASSERIALGLRAERCDTTPQCDSPTTYYRGVVTAPPGEPLARTYALCDDGDSCSEDGCSLAPAPDVSGQAVTLPYCAGHGLAWLTLVDYTPGAHDYKDEYTDAAYGRIAGPIVAARLFDSVGRPGDQVAVRNWRTGDELYRTSADATRAPFDVQDDGTLAFAEYIDSPHDQIYGISWASPTEPTPRVVAWVHGAPSALRIAGNRIAYMTNSDTYPGSAVEVRNLDGKLLASAPAPTSPGGLDFDGSRVTWAEQPCTVVSVLTWDLQGAPPAVATRCPAAGLVRRHAKVSRHRRLKLKLKCSQDPTLGCPGWLTITARSAARGHPRRVVAARPYSLRPGARRTLALATGGRIFCADARGDVRARVTLTARDGATGEPGAERTRTLRLSGPGLRTARCA